MQTDAHALRRKAAFFFTAPRRDWKRWFLPGNREHGWARQVHTYTIHHHHQQKCRNGHQLQVKIQISTCCQTDGVHKHNTNESLWKIITPPSQSHDVITPAVILSCTVKPFNSLERTQLNFQRKKWCNRKINWEKNRKKDFNGIHGTLGAG